MFKASTQEAETGKASMSFEPRLWWKFQESQGCKTESPVSKDKTNTEKDSTNSIMGFQKSSKLLSCHMILKHQRDDLN